MITSGAHRKIDLVVVCLKWVLFHGLVATESVIVVLSSLNFVVGAECLYMGSLVRHKNNSKLDLLSQRRSLTNQICCLQV